MNDGIGGKTFLGLFLISFTTLLVEVLLTRVFDFLLWPNLSFLVISCALFGLSLGGLFDLLSSSRRSAPPARPIWLPAALFAACTWALPLWLNAIPFSFTRVPTEPARQLAWFLLIYLALLAPFFFAGLSIAETAEALNVSHATIEREWNFARAWLRRELQPTDNEELL